MPRDGARAKPDKRGYVRIDDNLYCAGPVWHDRGLVVGVRARTVEALAGRGRHVATLGRSLKEGERVRDPVSLAPAPMARPRAFGGSTIRADVPDGLVDAIDQLDKAGRGQALRVPAETAETSGFKAACEAEEHILEGGRIPDEASADILARRIAAGRLEGGKRARPRRLRRLPYEGGGLGGRVRCHGRKDCRRRQEMPARQGSASRVGRQGHASPGRVPRGLPRGRVPKQGRPQAREPPGKVCASSTQDLRRPRMGPDRLARGVR